LIFSDGWLSTGHFWSQPVFSRARQASPQTPGCSWSVVNGSLQEKRRNALMGEPGLRKWILWLAEAHAYAGPNSNQSCTIFLRDHPNFFNGIL
jgi:hypothetical protein